jgi:hypothetical protein
MRKSCFLGYLAVPFVSAVVLIGCVGPTVEDSDEHVAEGAVRQGENEKSVLNESVASLDPQVTGVSFWRVIEAHHKDDGDFWLVTGVTDEEGREPREIVELVIWDSTARGDHPREPYLRSRDTVAPLRLDEERSNAIFKDFVHVFEEVWGDEFGDRSLEPAGLRPLGGPSATRPCLRDTVRAAWHGFAALVTGLLSIPLCPIGAIVLVPITRLADNGTLEGWRAGTTDWCMYLPSGAAELGAESWTAATRISSSCLQRR